MARQMNDLFTQASEWKEKAKHRHYQQESIERDFLSISADMEDDRNSFLHIRNNGFQNTAIPMTTGISKNGKEYFFRICCPFFWEKQIKSEIEDFKSYGLFCYGYFDACTFPLDCAINNINVESKVIDHDNM